MFTDITGGEIFTSQHWIVDDQFLASHEFPVHQPIVSGSASVYWNGVFLSMSNYRLISQLLICPHLPLSIGDEISIQYAILG